jgi:tetratricopeptide (TPR) repeat protein
VEAAEGHLDRAEQFYARALDIKRSLLGPEHPECAITAHNLGTLLRDSGRPEEAARHFRSALSIFEATLDADHPHIALCRANLAGL